MSFSPIKAGSQNKSGEGREKWKRRMEEQNRIIPESSFNRNYFVGFSSPPFFLCFPPQ